jgi:hypothetical protein
MGVLKRLKAFHIAAPEHAKCVGCCESKAEGDVVEKRCQQVDQLLQSRDVVLVLSIMGFHLHSLKGQWHEKSALNKHMGGGAGIGIVIVTGATVTEYMLTTIELAMV